MTKKKKNYRIKKFKFLIIIIIFVICKSRFYFIDINVLINYRNLLQIIKIDR